MAETLDSPAKRRQRLLLRLSAALGLVILLTAASWMYRRASQQRAIQQIESLGAERKRSGAEDIEEYGHMLSYSDARTELTKDLVPPIAWKLFGDEAFRVVSGVSLRDTQADGNDLQVLTTFTELKRLNLSGTEITDVDLRHLEAFKHLHSLALKDTGIGDQGMRHVGEVTGLVSLTLERSSITDTGLQEVSQLTRLQSLWLNDTEITDAGIECLLKLPALHRLDLRGTRVTDEGALQLSVLRSLHEVNLPDAVTRQAVTTLGTKMPECTFTCRGDAY